MRPASQNDARPGGAQLLAGGAGGAGPLARLATAADLLGRLGVAALFWWSALLDILPTWPETVDYVAAHGIPFPWAASVLAVVVEIGGPALLLTPGLETAGALVLAGYCLATAALFHAFWGLEGDARADQLVHFLKNAALAGALLSACAGRVQRQENPPARP